MTIYLRIYGSKKADEVEEKTGVRPVSALIEKRKGQPVRVIKQTHSKIHD